MNTFNFPLFWAALAAVMLAGACSLENLHDVSDPGTEASRKLIFSSENAVSGSLLVYFSEEAAQRAEMETTLASKAGGPCTKAGSEDFDGAIAPAGVISIERLFPVDPRHEQRTREAGLHRWYLVKFDPSFNLDAAAQAIAGAESVQRVEFSRILERVVPERIIPFTEGMPAAGMTKSPSANGNAALSQTPQFNDPQLENQWSYINTGTNAGYSGAVAGADVNCKEAWRLSTGDPRVIVAVVDDCVDWQHPDLAANMWTNESEQGGTEGVDDDGNGYEDDIHGYNFYTECPLTLSTEGGAYDHGTHVAGTVAAVNNNGIGVCGIAGGSGNMDGVRIMSCQIYHNDRGGAASAVARAAKYAADNGASVLQCSFGTDDLISDNSFVTSMSAEKEAIDYFIAASNCDAVDGNIVVFAAGNSASSMSGYPGGYRDYLSVTALSCDFTPAYYTNYGYGCNIAAPGGDNLQSYLENGTEASTILSTLNNGGYGYAQGTSMACPHVSGVVALGLSYALQQGLHFSRGEFISILLSSVNDINAYCTGTKYSVNSNGNLTSINLALYRGQMGTGAVDAYRFLTGLRGITCIPVTVGSQSQINVAAYVGDGNAPVTITSASISDEDMERLGISSQPRVFGGNVLLTCTKAGSGIISISMRAGTTGDGMYGMTYTRDFALIAKESHSDNGGIL